jgi:hypothetical protein
MPGIITTTDLVASAKRELAMRERVYPRQIDQGKMDQAKADHEIACQRMIVAILEEREQRESAQLGLFDIAPDLGEFNSENLRGPELDKSEWR